MSQTHSSAATRPTSIEHSARAPASVRAAPTVQAKHAFDVALQRAEAHESDDEHRPSPDGLRPSQGAGDIRRPRRADNENEPDDALGALLPSHPFAGQSAGQTPAAVAAGVLPGAAPQHMPLPPSHTGLSAESLPGQTAIGEARQLQLSLPADTAALNLRLTQAHPTHWQLRLSADTATRQQLAPHVERLRDRLRERQGQHTADFDLEDDSGAA